MYFVKLDGGDLQNTSYSVGRFEVSWWNETKKKVSQDLTDNHSTYLYLKRKTKKSNKVIEATCERTTEGFVVLEGSQVEIKDSPYLPASLKEMRQNLIASRVIQDGVLKEKQLFSSPSYAAAFLLGMQTNGRTDWKDQDGRTLKELEELIDW